jgi:hypothetical protein
LLLQQETTIPFEKQLLQLNALPSFDMFGHPPSTNEQQQHSKGQTDNCIQRKKISLISGIWFELKISLG